MSWTHTPVGGRSLFVWPLLRGHDFLRNTLEKKKVKLLLRAELKGKQGTITSSRIIYYNKVPLLDVVGLKPRVRALQVEKTKIL